jgi:major membrane immunogen (membrane-anchored lipoprotein)
MKQKLVLALVAIMLLTACKKDKKEISLTGKWTLENIISKEFINGTMTDQDIEPGNGATMDFQNNGQVVVTQSPGNVESTPYTIKPNSKVEIDGDIYDIQNLTASSVTLYNRETISANYYYEYLISLKR